MKAQYPELEAMADDEMFIEGAYITTKGGDRLKMFVKIPIKKEDRDKYVRDLREKYESDDILLITIEK